MPPFDPSSNLIPISDPVRAADLGRKSGIVRRRMRDELQRLSIAVASLTQQLADANHARTPEPLDAQFHSDRLAKVQRQLRAIDKRIDDELAKVDVHPKAVSELARASAILAEQERILAGRPLPGSLKPRNAASASQAHRPPPTPANPL